MKQTVTILSKSYEVAQGGSQGGSP